MSWILNGYMNNKSLDRFQRLGLGLRVNARPTEDICAYSPRQKKIVVVDIKSINCEVTSRLLSISTCYSRRPGSIRADAFRGHGFSLLAPARGMPTLSAQDCFSRPSSKSSTSVFWSRSAVCFLGAREHRSLLK